MLVEPSYRPGLGLLTTGRFRFPNNFPNRKVWSAVGDVEGDAGNVSFSYGGDVAGRVASWKQQLGGSGDIWAHGFW